MAQATLNDVIKQLQQNRAQNTNENTELMNTTRNMAERMSAFVEFLVMSRREDLERERERQNGAGRSDQQRGQDSGAPNNNLGLLKSLTTLSGLAAGFGGLGAALTGLGPSLEDLKKATLKFGKFLRAPIKPITETAFKPIDQAIRNKYTFLRNSILRGFGLDANLQRRDPTTGRFMPGKVPLSEQISTKYANLRASILKSFGLGVDVKPLAIPRAEQTTLTRIGKSIAKFSQGVSPYLDKIKNFIRPIGLFISGISAYSLGTGANFLKTTTDLVKNSKLTNILKQMVKFIRPIAIIFSAFSGIEKATEEMEALEKEGVEGFQKYIEGGIGGFVSGFFGDFFGSFFNLIKDAGIGLIKFAFPGLVGEDGKFKDDSSFGRLLNRVSDFDFKEKIENMIMAPFKFLGEFIDKGLDFLFPKSRGIEDDPKRKAEAEKYFGNFFDLTNPESGVSKLLNAIFAPVNYVLDGIGALFGIDDLTKNETFVGKINALFNSLVKFITDMIPTAEELQQFIIKNLSDTKLGRGTLDILASLGVLDKDITEIGKIGGRISGLQESLASLGPKMSMENMKEIDDQILRYENLAKTFYGRRKLSQDEKSEYQSIKAGLQSLRNFRDQQAELRSLEAEIAALKNQRETILQTVIGGSTSSMSNTSNYTLLSDSYKELAMDADAPGIY